MNILILGPLNQTTAQNKRLEPLIKFLSKKNYRTYQSNEKISFNFIKNKSIKMIICSGYPHIINKTIISLVKNRIINLHPAYLPHGKGVGALVFSLIKNHPIGITIHYIDKNVDTGKIIAQKLVNPRLNENFRSFYLRLLDELNKLFFREFKQIVSGKNKGKKQEKINDSDFYTRRRSEIIYEFFGNTYDINVSDLKNFSKGYLMNEIFFDTFKKL